MRRLVELPLSKSFKMAFQSIRVRFFRSMVTTVSLVLAVSFFTFIQASNDTAEGLLSSNDQTVLLELVKAGYDITPESGSIESSAKQRWILFLSLLVCVVGIINAQLMSVTERFREIGTLKCLGALDRFIVRLFLIEAAMQGITGGLVGAFLGSCVALGSCLATFGGKAFFFIPWGQLLVTIAVATGTGTLLSLLGVLYPAFIAARMQPVEAMRVDQ
ncbi:ABC transporter permease [Desulforhopalus singaporensis]|uniref:FtsX-like permease family protein n=1 Tax=Desulforhopalus singaporensis TaxID=91360 RepID=A0A1H0M7P9_9BACT|nr:FtsX-like permease family protein [Desulforhopalus singaporensis]SDO76130.1 FtsX-like permease family protein [Desulforhopalus singaporensis]